MKITHHTAVESQTVDMPGASKTKVRWLIGPPAAPNFAMRQFEIEPGGHTPRHHHDYEHEVYVLEGTGIVTEGDEAHPLKPGDVVFVQPNDVHQFRNTGSKTLKMLCLIPNSAAGKQVTVVPECGAEPVAQ
jgi:quercetin dioxygenase-like cupin family protein